jgi:hypothetical protein
MWTRTILFIEHPGRQGHQQSQRHRPRLPGATDNERDNDGGAVNAEVVLAAPLLMLILLTVVHFALWSHATHIAQTAAAQGLSAARAHTGTAAEGEGRARRTLDQLGDGPLHDATVHATRTDTQTRVEVTGVAAAVVPFLHLPVRAEAAGPVERFVRR